MNVTPQSEQAKHTCDDLMLLVSICKQHLNQIAKEYGLTSIQLFALRAISEGNTATGKIAHVLHCDASNVTGIIDRLTNLGLVTRKEDPHDRRVKTLQLTDKGESTLSDALALLPSKIGCGRLTPQDAGRLHDIIAKLINN